MRRTVASIGLVVSLASPVRAQEAVASAEAPQALCFRGRPLPHCRAFWVTEFGLALPDGPLLWELGGMRNIGPRNAVGGALYLRIDGGTAYGVKPRLRHWVSPAVALDVSPGIIVLAGAGNSVGFAGHVGLNYRDWLALTLQAETVPPDFEGGKRVKGYGGARLGAGLGAITGIAGFVVVGLVALALSGGGID